MKSIQGDLLALAMAGKFDVIIQGCNCQCRMGRGIALSIKQQFPEAFEADCTTTPGDRAKLGQFTCAEIVRGERRFTVVNAYTQFHWQGEGVLADYDAIRSAMKAIKARFGGQRIAYPRIGAGLARGDWAVISAIIEEELAGEDHTYVEFIPDGSPQP